MVNIVGTILDDDQYNELKKIVEYRKMVFDEEVTIPGLLREAVDDLIFLRKVGGTNDRTDRELREGEESDDPGGQHPG